ncbi:VWA domain-containing protein [Pseudoxanthomonas sp. LH2527]|uniref:tetratricopeptide repeat protein n=1 Tax=Pseudoxanthomonas sp. LH2527 TaxID=2923249 RepID=UPI001F12BE2C|nr:tetratricopeptide repeat protein [Pseudoxanthomonas sp. LH2527]MCH6482518.1 VWA domain-containing protein [Pseudoxanthomonas sp. LH2527]
MTFDLTALHFLRPHWLWALAALPVLAWAWRAQRQRRSAWRGHVDAHLLPHLLVTGGSGARAGVVVAAMAYVLAVLALAGPSWRQADQPLWQTQRPLVVVLDLSSRITAADLPPSRLLQVRAKLAQVLQVRAGSPVALVAYADDAFTVTPLTEDTANIGLFLDELSPEIMPRDGQHADRGIAWAARLLAQADARRGDILILTDRADSAAVAAAASARAQGYTVSSLGLGTASGAAYRGSDGVIGRAALDAASLRGLATAGGGRYHALTADDGDIAALGMRSSALATEGTTSSGGKAWRDEGYWLLIPLMALALLGFRRGAALALVGVLWLPMASPASAAGIDWWRRADQAEHARVVQGVDAYRQGDYAAAEQAFTGVDSAEGWYNLGNALAKQQRYDDAIAAYDRALRAQPGMQDAVANRAAVDAARKRPPSSGEGQGKPGQQGAGNQDAKGSQGDATSDPGSKQETPPPPAADKPASQRPGKTPPAPSPASSRTPPDAATQSAADAAQRERMRDAMARDSAQRAGQPAPGEPVVQAETAEQRERRQAVDAWLKRVPDEPGSLLKAKFRLEQERRQREGR